MNGCASRAPLSEIALPAANSNNQFTTFYPFVAHGGPVGVTPSEAKCVAWALTACAYQPVDIASKCVMDVSTTVQLQRDSRLANRLYACLRKRVGTDINVQDVETEVGFMWREVDAPGPCGQMRRLDPYFSQHITAAISESFHAFLFALPQRLAALPGLCNSQSDIMGMIPHINHACNTLYTRLLPFISGTKHDATYQGLVEEAKTCAIELTALHTGPARRIVEMQQAALRVLQSICSQAIAKESISGILFHNSDELHILASRPPHHLVDELRREMVPFSELAEFLVGVPRSGVHGAAALPPCLAARELSIQRWAERYGEAVLRAIVPAKRSLSVLSTAVDLDHAWHGLIVADFASPIVDVALGTGGKAAAVPCIQAAHLAACDKLALVSTAAFDPVALLIPRVVRVVLELIAQGHLGIRRLRADILVPIVSRINSEAEIERGTLVAQAMSIPGRPMPFEEDERDENESHVTTGDAYMDVDDDDASELLSQAHPPELSSHAHQAPPAPMEPLPQQIAAGDVPLSLERDHAIVVCTRDLLLELNATPPAHSQQIVLIPVRTTVARVLSRAYESLKASERSTTQSVGWVFHNKIANSFEGSEHIAYWRTDMSWPHDGILPKPKGACLVLTQQGCVSLCAHLEHIIDQMRNNGSILAKKWFPSRSARSHSRRSLWQRRNRSSDGGDPMPLR